MKTSPRTLISLTLAASALLVLSACGNKGPLVMPQKPVPVEEQLVEPAADDATPPAADADTDTDSPVVPDPVDAPVLKANDGNE
ncbi:lipoprotein [Stenotrophomonas sp. TWI700]|uniref:LPS translocon maturation chaperone LptM n=1 Tax=Stenotrophomonas sp. TWI700 TaxID=3136792 RepID=UPI003209E043